VESLSAIFSFREDAVEYLHIQHMSQRDSFGEISLSSAWMLEVVCAFI
jgi:hypothetical protein